MDDWTRKVVTEFLELSGEAQSRIDPELFHRLANLGVILGGERVAEIRGLPSASDAFQAGRESGEPGILIAEDGEAAGVDSLRSDLEDILTEVYAKSDDEPAEGQMLYNLADAAARFVIARERTLLDFIVEIDTTLEAHHGAK